MLGSCHRLQECLVSDIKAPGTGALATACSSSATFPASALLCVVGTPRLLVSDLDVGVRGQAGREREHLSLCPSLQGASSCRLVPVVPAL